MEGLAGLRGGELTHAVAGAFTVGWKEVLDALETLSGRSSKEMAALRGAVRAVLAHAGHTFGAADACTRSRANAMLHSAAGFDGTASVFVVKFCGLRDDFAECPARLRALCSALVARGELIAAARIVSACNAHGAVDSEALVRSLVESGMCGDAIEFAGASNDTHLRALAINLASAARKSKMAAKAVEAFGLDWRDFPTVVRARALDTLRWRHRAGHLELAEALVSEFPALCAQHEALLAVRRAAPPPPPHVPPVGGYVTLLPGSSVVLVADVAALECAVTHLLQARFVGMDAEWTAPATRFTPPACALLQLAVGSSRVVYVLDLVALRAAAIAVGGGGGGGGGGEAMRRAAGALRRLLFCDAASVAPAPLAAAAASATTRAAAATAATIVGFALQNDFEQLKLAWPEVGWRGARRPIVDLARDAGKGKGLTHLCNAVLGHPLDKREQMSDWSARPLRAAQLAYAALDAQVLLVLRARLRGGKGAAGEGAAGHGSEARPRAR